MRRVIEIALLAVMAAGLLAGCNGGGRMGYIPTVVPWQVIG